MGRMGPHSDRKVEIMKIKLMPQIPLDQSRRIQYKFVKNSVEVTIDGVTDIFDFNTVPDGTLDTSSVVTDLPVNPFHSVKKVDGVIWMELMVWVKPTEKVSEDWIDHTNYTPPRKD